MKIKFRVWDNKRNLMLDSKKIVYSDGRYYEDYRDFEDGVFLENITVMQYTGVFDKNGVEICEGDWVQIERAFPVEHFKVWYKNGMFYIGNWHTQGFMNAFNNFMVIGNIYENKH